MKFRPCIDIHNGLVKQIIGGSFNDDKDPIINFTSKRTAKWYAEKYAQDNLSGGHIIKIGLDFIYFCIFFYFIKIYI